MISLEIVNGFARISFKFIEPTDHVLNYFDEDDEDVRNHVFDVELDMLDMVKPELAAAYIQRVVQAAVPRLFEHVMNRQMAEFEQRLADGPLPDVTPEVESTSTSEEEEGS